MLLNRLLGALFFLLPLAASAPSFAIEQIVYYHNDVFGNPVAATDSTGTAVWQETYAPYGDRMKNQAGSNKLWFQAKPSDAETGLSYFGARYYDPAIGRFMGMDPKGFDEGNLHSFNRYAYGNNNPYRFTDADGKSPLSIFFFEVAKQTGAGYLLGVAADSISQYAAWGTVDLSIAATSNAAIAGGEAGLLSGAVSGAFKGYAAAKEAKALAGAVDTLSRKWFWMQQRKVRVRKLSTISAIRGSRGWKSGVTPRNQRMVYALKFTMFVTRRPGT